MIDPLILRRATIALVILLAGMVAWQVVKSTSEQPAASKEREPNVPELNLGSFAQPSFSSKSEDAADDARGELTLRVGKIGSAPRRDEITVLKSLPDSEREWTRAYTMAKANACRIVAPGASVSAPLSMARTGQHGELGRLSAITIGLEMASQGRQKLPAVTRQQVDQYFEDHRLSVQPQMFYDEQKRVYFGTDCAAAFFEIERPGYTIEPEPMINVAVSRFRTLGIVGMPEDSGVLLGRTLALMFAFEKSDDTVSGVADGGRQALELMLLHLPPESTADDFKIEVYITSDERASLHRLDLGNEAVNSPLPTISSEVRFDKMILMGMYPAEPVVTKIHFRSAGILSMEMITRLSRGTSERTAMSLTEILDEFGKLSMQSPIDTSPKYEDAEVAEAARRKYERLRAMREEVSRDDEISMPSMRPLMTGLDD
ncbi:putative transmembrane protein [Rhodopirellula islandica]|uniref:Transmembrane protein n=1 Tax=Rhodopirellula islandica TaxID=595434 RepID=A0A0J1EAH1_RHOIS|nr:hypothetical protein [Rhodopirellula islandica]KLU02554.1 putative transmembrane protein [Rhodopirellula islandica]